MKSVKRFAIQKHTRGGNVHWDLMLEVGSVLETYRLELPPEELLQQKTTTVRIFDHPLKFLIYEGSVNKGEGSVRIADAGTYEWLSKAEDLCQLRLNGKILTGKFTLTHVKGDRWEFSLS